MYSRPRLLPWILASLPIAAFAQAPAEGGRAAIVDRAIEHHGGEIYRHSETELDLCSKSGCFHVVARVDGDRFAYVVSGKSGGARLEVRSTNDALEVSRNGEPLAVEPAKQRQYRDWAMARVYFCFLPFRLGDPSVIQQDLGLVDWQGRRLHKVKVTFEPGTSTDSGDEYVYWFDPESARLEYFAYSYDDNGGGLRFRRNLRHRRAGGLLFFDQENYGVDGGGADGPDLSVDSIDAAYVRDAMRHVSTVRLEGIEVRSLP